MDSPCPIYVVDDDTRMRQHLVRLLRGQKFAPTPFSTGSDFGEAMSYLAPGIALLELRLIEMNGVPTIADPLSRRQDIPVIVMAANGDIPTAVKVIKRGAVDFLEKPFTDHHLLKMLASTQTLHQGRIEAQERKDRAEVHLHSLTTRELDIMRALGSHRNNRMVAEEFNLSLRTVEMHRARIMKKFGAKRFDDVLREISEAGLE
ncbi:response regulator transcription factor [Sphingobium sp. TB-6]|uniref:response regulator transcription factor n=1 Tax=Sphingobium sp. TB-6 TaxID=2728850 RepID=UPI00146E05D7|nr:response regulator [Sphingobium sp. TB-6]NML91281.1 response regulator transcription factor [Sphingobium sp. TB-6]